MNASRVKGRYEMGSKARAEILTSDFVVRNIHFNPDYHGKPCASKHEFFVLKYGPVISMLRVDWDVGVLMESGLGARGREFGLLLREEKTIHLRGVKPARFRFALK